MPECEICGRSASLRAVIEGSWVYVCSQCSKHAEAVEEIKPVQRTVQIKKIITIEESKINPDFASIVKQSRENAKLTRKDLARKIKEKESVIERTERGNIPEDKVAKKLEAALRIKLLGFEEAKVKLQKKKDEEITLGDVVEVRLKRK